VSEVVGSVQSLHRYPVKSMLGESLTALDVDERGVAGDRQWSVRTVDGKIGSGKSTARFDAVVGLLDARAALRDGSVVVTLAEGGDYAVDDPAAGERLSALLGRPLTFARETDVSHFDDGPVSLIGLASISALAVARGQHVDPARFRANIVLDTEAAFVEDEWIGRTLRVGTATLEVILPSPRCVMINMASADLPGQPGNLAALGRLHDNCLGVIARVAGPGQLAVGDELSVL
jgi:uncharacterized protein YcbX